MKKLAALGEILGHIADDARGGGHFPFPTGAEPWNEADFLVAMEQEVAPRAIRLLRGALSAGLTADDLLPSLAAAALAHYAGFGHSLIYVVKTVELTRRLGADVAEKLLCLLVRNLVYARREDLLPEFRDYARCLAAWGQSSQPCPPLEPSALRGMAAKSAMATTAAWGARHSPEAMFPVLAQAAAWNLLHADEDVFTRTDGKLADNVGWLDFTHAVTFAEAAQVVVRRRPDLWPAVLLQLACFIGRNAGYVDPDLDTRSFAVGDVESFVTNSISGLFDHGRVGSSSRCT